MRLGLNLGPSPMHARNVYLVLNLITGCDSPQYHCRFDDFFETTCHNGPDVNDTISRQLLVGLNSPEMILSEVSVSTQHSIMYNETQSEANVPLEEISVHTSLQWTITASQTEILQSQKTCNHLTNPGLLIKMRELQVLSLLSQLVQVNGGEFALCHEKWLSQLPKVSIIWLTSVP
jgi:hypothetical protein